MKQFVPFSVSTTGDIQVAANCVTEQANEFIYRLAESRICNGGANVVDQQVNTSVFELEGITNETYTLTLVFEVGMVQYKKFSEFVQLFQQEQEKQEQKVQERIRSGSEQKHQDSEPGVLEDDKPF